MTTRFSLYVSPTVLTRLLATSSQIAAGTVAGLWLSAGTARAQTVRATEERISELEVGLEVRHDSNVAHSTAAQAARSGLERADERVTPTLSLRFNRPFGRNAIAIEGSVGYDFYRRNDVLERERIGVAADLMLRGGPCRADIMPTFGRRQSNLTDILPLGGIGDATVRNVETTQSYRGELACGRAYGLSPYLSAERSLADNSQPVREISDSRTTELGGGVRLDRPPLGEVTLAVTHGDTTYPKRLLVSGGKDGFSVDRLSVSASRRGPTLGLNATVSYARLNPDDPTVPGFKGVNWNIAVTTVPAPRLRAEFLLANEVAPALNADASYERTRSVGVRGALVLNPQLKATFTADVRSRRFIGENATFGPAISRDRRTGFGAGLNFTPLGRLSYTLSGQYERRAANGTLFDYSNVSVALSARFKF